MDIMIWVCIGIAMGIACGSIAAGKNRSATAWGVFGFFVPILAVIIIALIGPAQAESYQAVRY